ncbi:unnamed protein product [Choristocarpus tenellus]
MVSVIQTSFSQPYLQYLPQQYPCRWQEISLDIHICLRCWTRTLHFDQPL